MTDVKAISKYTYEVDLVALQVIWMIGDTVWFL
jgi:hypothetical protein